MTPTPKIVLDTNVLISLLIAKIDSSPRRIFNLFRQEKISVFTSQELLNELNRALNYPKIKKFYRLSSPTINRYLEFLQRHTQRTAIKTIPRVIKADPDDNLVLACALAAKANYLISGDRHLLSLKNYKRIKIVAPSEFIRLYHTPGV